MEDPIYGFNEQDKDNLIRLIGSSSTSGVGGGSSFIDYDATRLTLALATAGVPARSGTTLGKGVVAVQHLAISGTNRVITDSGVTMEAYNLATTAVAPGVYVLLLRLGDVAIVVWEEC